MLLFGASCVSIIRNWDDLGFWAVLKGTKSVDQQWFQLSWRFNYTDFQLSRDYCICTHLYCTLTYAPGMKTMYICMDIQYYFHIPCPILLCYWSQIIINNVAGAVWWSSPKISDERELFMCGGWQLNHKGKFLRAGIWHCALNYISFIPSPPVKEIAVSRIYIDITKHPAVVVVIILTGNNMSIFRKCQQVQKAWLQLNQRNAIGKQKARNVIFLASLSLLLKFNDMPCVRTLSIGTIGPFRHAWTWTCGAHWLAFKEYYTYGTTTLTIEVKA